NASTARPGRRTHPVVPPPPYPSPQGGGIIASHIHIVRPAAALGGDPVDVLVRVLDVAGLAVDAVLGVDLIAHAPLALDPFIDARRAVALRGAAIDIVLGRLLQAHVLDLEMDRLGLF